MLPSNQRRIIRALEVYYSTGKPISQHHGEHEKKKFFNPVFVGLQWERKKLYDRINFRVERMLAAGFLDEVKGTCSPAVMTTGINPYRRWATQRHSPFCGKKSAMSEWLN